MRSRDQEQFLDVVDRDEAEARFHAALQPRALGVETIALSEALGRILAADVLARVDVPGFDRSNYDGFAVRADDTIGASELAPREVRLRSESIDAGAVHDFLLLPREAVPIATGGMLPRGADAIEMVEHCDVDGNALRMRRAVPPGFGIAHAGSDVARGETVLRAGIPLTSRETGVLAAIGEEQVRVWRQPRVAILATGDELIAPGTPMTPARVYDSNTRILSDAVREIGGIPVSHGIAPDDFSTLRERLRVMLAESDVVLLSGGTSKGQGDVCQRVVAELRDPGIVAHGVALKPGKPLCLAVSGGKPVVVLPGFPTSAIFTFHEFVAPIIRLLGSQPAEPRETVRARLAVKTPSTIGRTEYLLVGLVQADDGLVAYPLGKGSGSVTTFSRADGFVTIPRHTELVEAHQSVEVCLLSRGLQVADLVVVGSHCVGLDYLLSRLHEQGLRTKLLTVGSSAGLAAAQRMECDVAGVHLLDPTTGEYNRPFVTDGLELIAGYGRLQGILVRRDDARFARLTIQEIVARGTADPNCLLVNRNQGSGTRILLDRLLAGARPNGYAVQVSSHNSVAAAIAQGRADWGLAIESVARDQGLAFLPYQEEQYDFVVPRSRLHRPAVQAFLALLHGEAAREQLARMGFRPVDDHARTQHVLHRHGTGASLPPTTGGSC